MMKKNIYIFLLIIFSGYNAYSVGCNFKIYDINYTGDSLYIDLDAETWSPVQIANWDYKIYVEGVDLYFKPNFVSVDTGNTVNTNGSSNLPVHNLNDISCDLWPTISTNPVKLDTTSFPFGITKYGIFWATRGGWSGDKIHQGWIKIIHNSDSTFTLLQYGYSLNPDSSIMVGTDECNPCSKDIITNSASSVTVSRSTLNGTVVAKSDSVKNITFDYGTTISYGSSVAGNPPSVAGTTNANITVNISGLTANATYHFRINAFNKLGTQVYGADKTFTTLDKTSQSITFNALTSSTYGEIDFDPGATASSGLEVTYSSSNTAVATIVSNKLHIVAAGTVTVYADQAGDTLYYPALQVPQLLTVNAKTLTVTGATAANKVYDGTTTATISGSSLVGIVVSDVVTLATANTGTFASANVGTGISVTTAMTLTGAAACNYTLTQPTLTANITAKALTISGATAANKVYDGTTAATISGGTLNGIVGSDLVTLANSTSGTFASANVGTGISVNTAMTLTGAAGNYTLTQPTLTANITAKALTVTGATAANKVYDGTTAANISGGTLNGIVGSDVVTLVTATTGTFASANVGTGISVTTAMTLTGAAGNYTLTQPALTANITAKALTVTGAAAANRVYDGTTIATISGGTLSGIVGSDMVTLATATSGAFASANISTGISVTTAMTLTGAAAGNYTLTQPTLTANITPKTLTVTATDKSKTYGDANPSLTVTYSGFVGTESTTSLTIVPTATTTATQFSDVNTYSIIPAGGVATNYTFTYVDGVLTVNKARLDVTANNASREKGNPNPVFTFSYSGFKGIDEASVIDVLPTAFCAADASSDVGEYDIVLTGGSDNNYNLMLHNGKLTVTPATAISSEKRVAISVYPNPVSDYIYINNLPEKTVIRIFNLQGNLVENIISANRKEKIDVKDLPLGVYIIKLSGKEIETTVCITKNDL